MPAPQDELSRPWTGIADQDVDNDTELSPAIEPSGGETEEIVIRATWETEHHVTVPIGWEVPAKLSDIPDYVLTQMRIDAPSARLMDWR